MKRIISQIFVILYLGTGLVPLLGSVDVAATQILYLQMVNVLGILYFSLFQRENFKNIFEEVSSRKQIFLFFLFIIWSILTISQSINIGESLRVLSNLVVYLTSFILLLFYLKRIKNAQRFLINSVLILLGVEVFYILFLFLGDISNGTFNPNTRNPEYKGITGNINIAAFSIVIKIPLLFYKIFSSNRRVYLYYLLYSFSIFTIFYLLKTRSAFIAIFFITFLAILYSFYNQYNSKKRSYHPYILAAVVLLVFNINIPLNSVFDSSKSTFNRLATLADENNKSVNERLRYYGQAFDTFLENPILGIGIGNWELKSIETDSENIYGYTVPYHAHNDYLELAAETGLVGMALYFSILVTVIFRLLKQLFLNRNDKSNVLYYFLVCSLAVYLIDALFNFPTARPIQQMNMLILLSFAMTLFKEDSNKTADFLKKYRLNKGVLFILLLVSPVALYSSYRVYHAYTQHYYLLGQYNTNNYVQDLDQVLEYEDTYPSLLPTTIPTSTMKGVFHIKKNKDYKSAIKYFKKGIKDNPYLMMSETYIGYSYLMLDQLDSAYYYSKKAFDKIPNNPVHFANYLFALSKKRDTLAIQEARKRMPLVKNKKIDALYYKALANLLDKDNSRVILNNLSQELLNTNNDDLKGSIYVLEYGKEMVLKAALLHEKGVHYFENRNYEMAGKSFEEASKLNRLEVPYFENAANAYIQAGKNQKALEILNTVLEEVDDQNSKVMYMKALVLLDLNKNEEACVLLNKLINGVNELKIPRTVLDNFCNSKD